MPNSWQYVWSTVPPSNTHHQDICVSISGLNREIDYVALRWHPWGLLGGRSKIIRFSNCREPLTSTKPGGPRVRTQRGKTYNLSVLCMAQSTKNMISDCGQTFLKIWEVYEIVPNLLFSWCFVLFCIPATVISVVTGPLVSNFTRMLLLQAVASWWERKWETLLKLVPGCLIFGHLRQST